MAFRCQTKSVKKLATTADDRHASAVSPSSLVSATGSASKDLLAAVSQTFLIFGPELDSAGEAA
jgi:hypothetical protein